MRARGGGILLLLVGGAAAVAADDFARTATGRPDFSGNYDISLLTPLQRSPDLADRLWLTEEEAAAIEGRTAELVASRNRPSDPARGAPDEGGDVGGYNFFWLDRGTRVVRVDGRPRSSILIDPPNGRLPPLTVRGRERREALFPFSKKNTGTAWWLDLERGPYDGPESLSIADRCVFSLEATIPALPKNYNNIKTLVQTDDHLMILVEWMHEARIVRLGEDGRGPEHAPAEIRSRSGDSIGWWEGDTLVVETTNFLEEEWITETLFGEPSPRAEQRVIERFTPAPGGLLYRFTVESPDFEAPYSGEFVWPRTDDKLYEYACNEGNYAVGNILRGARLLEADDE